MSKTQSYPSDLTDEQWQLIRPLLPKRKRGKAGRPRTVEQRDRIDGIFYILRSGCPWRMLPHDFPPWGTVASQFYRWRKSGLWDRMHDALRRQTRMAAGREPLPSVGIRDSQSVTTTEAGGPRGQDGGKKVSGRKRHVLVDTLGCCWRSSGRRRASRTTKARSGLRPDRPEISQVENHLRRQHLRVQRAGDVAVLPVVAGTGDRQAAQGEKGWVRLAKRWIVERTFAWLSRCRRLSKDYERSLLVSEAWIRIAVIQHMIRRLEPLEMG